MNLELIRTNRDEAQSKLDEALLMAENHPDRRAFIAIYTNAVANAQHEPDLDAAGITHEQFRDYRNREIVDFINAFLTVTPLHYDRPGQNPGTEIIARSARGVRYLIVGYTASNGKNFMVRGVLKEKRRGLGIGYLCNGQAGRNAAQVAQFDEVTCVVPAPQSPEAYIAQYGRP